MLLLGVLVAVAGKSQDVPPAAAPEPSLAMGPGCVGAVSAVQVLAKVVNTRDRNYNCLGVEVDAKANVTGIRFEGHDMAADPQTGQLVQRAAHVREFTLEEVASEHGAVLDGRPGHDAIILHGRISPSADMSALVVRFLYNGITGDFRQCDLALGRGPRGDWQLRNAANQVVSSIVVRTWRLPLVGTVGIDTLSGVCPDG